MQKLLLENLLTRIFWLFRTDTGGVQWFDGGRGQAVDVLATNCCFYSLLARSNVAVAC